MNSDFDRIIDFTLAHEGGLSEDRDDPGGVTNFGISQRFHPTVDVRHLTREQAATIYRRDYWDRYGCGQLDWPLSGAYFEACVNPGVAYARAWRSSASCIHEFLLLRAEHYREIAHEHPERAKYFRGWMNRVLDFFVKFTGD